MEKEEDRKKGVKGWWGRTSLGKMKGRICDGG